MNKLTLSRLTQVTSFKGESILLVDREKLKTAFFVCEKNT